MIPAGSNPHMPLKLTYRATTSIPVEVEGLLPEALRGLSLAEVERFEVQHGNQKCPLAEFFSVAGNADDSCLEFEGDLAGVHWLGTKMTEGTIRVAGSIGRHVGSEMRGGEIHVAGDASDGLGREMHGGLIHVAGRAGDRVGAAYPGSKRGMTGGTILVLGPAGSEIGHTMRRGLIATGGAGDFAGINMIAGTILVFGDCGLRPGANMRRGTIGLFGQQPPKLLPTFREGGCDYLLVMRLVFRELTRLGYPLANTKTPARYRMFHGDLVSEGRGEILLPA
jgi:formylmethanofuran dehydrogenase subunit C